MSISVSTQDETIQRPPVQFEFMKESTEKPIIDLFPGQDEGMIIGHPGGFVFTPEFGRRCHEIYQFKPRQDDAWVCTFSKSGIVLISSKQLPNSTNFYFKMTKMPKVKKSRLRFRQKLSD